MCMLPSQLLLVTHMQLSSKLLAPINNATYVYVYTLYTYVYIYICIYSPKTAIHGGNAMEWVDTKVSTLVSIAFSTYICMLNYIFLKKNE